MVFVEKLAATHLGNDEEDTVMRQVVTEEYRQAVLKAAGQNIEVSLTWHTLATWTEEGKERIVTLRGAGMSPGRTAPTRRRPQRDLVDIHTQADCLFEIGRVHFHEGAPEAARRFLAEAMHLAKQADAIQHAAGVTDDLLEGRVAELMLQLPGCD